MEQTAATATNLELMDRAARLGTEIAEKTGELMELIDEIERRSAFRDEGAVSGAAWLSERLGLSEATSRQWSTVARRLWDLPELAGALRRGAISFDKAAVASAFATTLTDADVAEQAQECSVAQLNAVARAARGSDDHKQADQHDGRYVRFNDQRRTLSAQLPADDYALVRNAIDATAKHIPSDGVTPFDQRTADALIEICREAMGWVHDDDGPAGDGVVGKGGGGGGGSGSHGRRATGKPLVVVHADLSMLRGGKGTAEMVRFGLLSPEAARRLTCDADVALAIDDAFGHTMVEGRARRFPTEAQRREVMRRDRHCRFTGCPNVDFVQIHHIVHWTDGGTTDLDNLIVLCDHHHHRIHEGKWQMSGNGNGTVRFLGPTERMMTSRPSPLWTRRN
jgi:Domain of unknown function (DUF222)/HNH endonuclease